MIGVTKKEFDDWAARWWEEMGALSDKLPGTSVPSIPKPEPSDDWKELTRLKTIERAALALLVNRKDLGLIGQREALMSDLATAFGPIDPKKHQVKYP